MHAETISASPVGFSSPILDGGSVRGALCARYWMVARGSNM